MSRILLIANLNCDRLLRLEQGWCTGSRLQARSEGYRLGGGGANTGVGLVYGGHHIALAAWVGDDERGHWLIAEAQRHGLDTRWVSQYRGPTAEVYLLLAPDGERTLLFVDRPAPQPPLPSVLEELPDLIYVNSACVEVAELMAAALSRCWVVAQWPKAATSRWPAHLLIASAEDLAAAGITGSPWQAGYALAGEALHWVIVTRGGEGATAYGPHSRISVPAPAAEVVDTTGAGDTFAAGVIDGLLADLTIHDLLKRAALWASFTVASPSSIPPLALKRYLEGDSGG